MLNRASTAGAAELPRIVQGFDLRQALNFVWRQWKLIVAVLTAAILIGAAYLAVQVRLYTATTLILLDPRKEKATDAILSDVSLDWGMVESQVAIIRSSSLLRRVVEKENLLKDPEFGLPPSAQEPATDEAIAAAVLAASARLRGALEVRRSGQAYVLSISVTSADPNRAARLANAVADAYVVDQLDARFEAAQRASSWLGDRLEDLKKQLRASEEAVARFRTEKGLQQTGTNVTLSQGQLGQLNERLVAARAETAEKKARLDVLRSTQQRGQTNQAISDASGSNVLSTLRTQEADISRREADLAARYSDAHPLIVNIRAEKRDVQRGIAAEIARISEKISSEYEVAKSREAAIHKTLDEVTGQTGIDGRTAITLRELERTAEVNRKLYEEFLQKAKVTQEQSTFAVREARVITPAVPPGGPSSPNKSRTLLIVAFLGLMCGVGGAFALEMLNAGFSTPRQVEEMLGVPVLASVSLMSSKELTINGKVVPLLVYTVLKPLSRFSEAIRSLRSGIQMTDVDNPPRIIQVTSAMPAEGKSSIAQCLAASAACSNLKVLFIDADLRNPSATRFFGLNREAGLVELLLGEADARSVIRYYEAGRFWTLSAGGRTQNPPDLLGSERMRSLVASFATTFDYVILDTPPLGPVIDPVIVSQLAEKIVFIVRWSSTTREVVEQSIKKISTDKKVAGIVLNQTDDARLKKYGQGAYSYYGTAYYDKYYSA